MQIINTIAALRAALSNQGKVAFVPTMGNLHAGHLHLVALAKQHANCVVTSIFVNPLQFGKNEDFGNYPRTLADDCDKLRQIGTDIVFAPNVKEMYLDFDGSSLNQSMTISLPPIANELCGTARPGHFAGVATVVMKLFNIVNPDVAIFGKKDFQQLFIIRELVRQFNLPIEIIAGETIREASGLAMSSRNGYLSVTERASASQLNSALQTIVSSIKSGNKDYTQLQNQAIQQLSENGWLVDYIAVRSAATLQAPSTHDTKLVALGAASLGKTRLIDNIEFKALLI